MMNMQVRFNEENYNAIYNAQTGYYELELQAPSDVGGIYNALITFTDLLDEQTTATKAIQIFIKEQIKIQTNKVFMWIFDANDFSVKDIVELSDYEINIDEETNSNTIIKVLKETRAKAEDIIVVKKNNEVVYWGKIEEISNEDGSKLYEYTVKYITNIFDQKVLLNNENLIRTTGIEDFIANAITNNFISNTDTFVNKNYLELDVKTHTPKEISVTNVENGIYNLHTWMTNCTQNYNIVYSFSIVNKKLKITIENKEISKKIIDTQAQEISNYKEVFETNIISKVMVKYDKVNDSDNPGIYTLYLKNDRTTTTDSTDVNRAAGKTEAVYTENYEDANQTALDTIKSNSYNHNITFNYLNRFIPVGTPIAIKTKKSLIFNTYISSIKLTPKKFIEYTCGNIRINFIDKLLKERN